MKYPRWSEGHLVQKLLFGHTYTDRPTALPGPLIVAGIIVLFCHLKPNSITLITLADSKLVADRLEAGRRPASNLSATSFEPASVMEFGF